LDISSLDINFFPAIDRVPLGLAVNIRYEPFSPESIFLRTPDSHHKLCRNGGPGEVPHKKQQTNAQLKNNQPYNESETMIQKKQIRPRAPQACQGTVDS